ncbi:biotin/lipoate A/B protein ligase family protein [Candidatus Omnitrophota bacterium]
MPKEWRLIDSGPGEAFDNMALDEALFLSYAQSGLPTLRIYRWSRASLSFGFSQSPEAVLDPEQCRRQGIPFVRRITGGGVLLHSVELTYSLTCSRQDLQRPSGVKDGFKLLCSFLLVFYRHLGLRPFFSIDFREPGLRKPSSFCPAAREDYDILIDNKKIGGNAQRRRKDCILQQGSIPVYFDLEQVRPLVKGDLSAAAGTSTCLKELLGSEPDPASLSALLRLSFEESFACTLREARPTGYESGLAASLARGKYASKEWNINRSYAKTVLVG